MTARVHHTKNRVESPPGFATPKHLHQSKANTMTPNEAATMIQNAWRVFNSERKNQFYESYEDELNATYYASCYTPGMWDEDYYDPYDY